MATSRRTTAPDQNAELQHRSNAIAEQVATQENWLERKLKPKKITARYPFKGKLLLYATCGFGSLGDGLFGYNSGMLLHMHHLHIN